MTLEELVVLAHTARGVGASTLTTLLHGLQSQCMVPDDLLRLSYREIQERFGLSTHAAGGLAHALARKRHAARHLLERLAALDVTIITCLDAAYPQALIETMRDPPPVLYARGDVSLLRRRLICLANSHGCPADRSRIAEQALERAVEAGFVPVTGHNRPEYQLPALVARRRAVPVCYVLDRGLLEVGQSKEPLPPFRAARIWSQSAEQRDLVISPFAPSAPYVPGSNRQRDGVIVGLATCVLASYLRPDGNMAALLTHAGRARKRIGWLGNADELPEAIRSLPDLAVLGTDGNAALGTWLTASLTI